ncbi:hypothetical protein V8G54_012510, partial [Vigna mungo]
MTGCIVVGCRSWTKLGLRIWRTILGLSSYPRPFPKQFPHPYPNRGLGSLCVLCLDCRFWRRGALLQFNIPNLCVGTLDTLLSLSDDLTKLNNFVERVTHKIKRQIEELQRVSGVDSGGVIVDGVPVDSYLTRFASLFLLVILQFFPQSFYSFYLYIQINYNLKALNHKWRDCRQELWQLRDDGTCTREELIAMAPDGIDRDHWASFVDYRLDERTKEKECGHKVSRGEVWIATHKKTNGAFANDEAREIGLVIATSDVHFMGVFGLKKIQAYESTTPSQSKEISSSDSLAHVLGSQEHRGRVRDLGLGPLDKNIHLQ